MTRDESQTEFKNLFKANKGIGVGLLCTGYGKTKCALDLCEDLDKLRKTPAHKIVVVPSHILKEQWERLIKKRKIKETHVFVVNSFVIKYASQQTDFLICDEIHRFSNEDSELFSKVVTITKYKYFLGLSGTLEEKHKSFLASKNIPILKEITREEAVKNGWVSNYSIYTLMLKLNEEDEKKHQLLKKQIKTAFAYFNSRTAFDEIMKCVANKEYRKMMAAAKGIEEGHLFVKCKQGLDAIRNRKTILQDCDTKEKIILEITSKMKAKTIIFGQSTDFSDRIANQINQQEGSEIFLSVHSKKKKKENKESLRKLADNRYKIRGVSSAKALSEGLDIPDLELGIMASYTSSSVVYNQSVGRICRLFKDKHAIMINLCVEDSQEETWLEKNGGMSESRIVYSVDEIINYEKGLNLVELG